MALLEASQDAGRAGPFEGLLRSPVPAALGPSWDHSPQPWRGPAGPRSATRPADCVLSYTT